MTYSSEKKLTALSEIGRLNETVRLLLYLVYCITCNIASVQSYDLNHRCCEDARRIGFDCKHMKERCKELWPLDSSTTSGLFENSTNLNCSATTELSTEQDFEAIKASTETLQTISTRNNSEQSAISRMTRTHSLSSMTTGIHFTFDVMNTTSKLDINGNLPFKPTSVQVLSATHEITSFKTEKTPASSFITYNRSQLNITQSSTTETFRHDKASKVPELSTQFDNEMSNSTGSHRVASSLSSETFFAMTTQKPHTASVSTGTSKVLALKTSPKTENNVVTSIVPAFFTESLHIRSRKNSTPIPAISSVVTYLHSIDHTTVSPYNPKSMNKTENPLLHTQVTETAQSFAYIKTVTLVPCLCNARRFANKTFQTSIHDIAKRISIDAKNTSVSRRKYKSVTDDREVSKVLGIMGILLLVVLLALVFLIDCSKVFPSIWARLRKERK